jgi:hypothetical protein
VDQKKNENAKKKKKKKKGGFSRPDTYVAILPTVTIRPGKARTLEATRPLKQK